MVRGHVLVWHSQTPEWFFHVDYDKNKDYVDVDGLVTNVPGLTLATFYADCVPLFLVDPVHKAVGLSHSGWKGTVKRIGPHSSPGRLTGR